jgi:DNA-3-methyladenine glycosylase II
VFVVNKTPVKITVVSQKAMNKPQFVVTLQVKAGLTDRLRKDVRLLIQKMLRPTIDLQSFYALSSKDHFLRPLAQQYRGVKPPRFPTIFEALVNSICCQQLTLDFGILMINRLAENFGIGFTDGGITYRAFPSPEDLAIASERDIRELGFSYQKVRATRELSINVANQ